MSQWKKMWRLVPLFAVMSLLLAGCGDPSQSALLPRGPYAQGQFDLMMLSIIIMVSVVVVVFLIYFYVIIRFRKRKGQTGVPKQVEGSHLLEVIWTVIPIILLVILAVPTINTTFKSSEDLRKDKDALLVKVTGHQFWWEFEYPTLGIHTAQDLVIPAGKKIAFELSSADVTHSFWVPSLGGKIDTNVGSGVNTLPLQADEPGIYRGKCAELCGDSHSLMDFKVIAKTDADFDAWVNKMKTPATVSADAQKGQDLFKQNCMSCHATDVKTGSFGPNLNGFASREKIAGILKHDDANLKAWIKDPQEEKVGNKMPKVPLKDNEIDEIVKYLNTLK
ncbi:cytochrome c oxidase subunit II [Paenibacillus sp. KN14-4R]|uniref:cytochrome c oxidase subunit II n=1 Tax=Paenibacillus sp. KN14-4R TaxID=3445773 RepID=UPI003FA16FD4